MTNSATFLLLLLLLLLLELLSPSQPLSSDGLILLAMKQALSDPLNYLANWPSAAAAAAADSPCSWTGVSCNHNLSVIALNFSRFYLRGRIPTLMCRLPDLVSVDFYYNNFGGSIPDALLDCSHLTHLVLSDNRIVGGLPPLIDRLQSLQVLDLSDNNISGPIPDSFGKLPRLVTLGLSGNFINGTVPPFLGQLQQLQYLGLAWNPLSAGPIPPELGNLTRLTYLWFTNCNLTGSIPQSLANLTKLETLDFARNSLTGPIPEFFTTFRSLVQLELFQNFLSGPIPHDFGMLSKLTAVDMSKNHLSGSLPLSFTKLRSLRSLHLYYNDFSGDLPAGFEELPVEDFSIFDNFFTGPFPQAFGKSSNLTTFDVSSNNFSGPLPAHLCDKRALLNFDTIQNNFEGTIPEAYAACSTLRRLRLSSNRLTGTVPTALWGLQALVILDLQNNQLQGSISSTLGMASGLTVITLDNNCFSGSLPVEIGKVWNLSTISASHNQLSGRIPSSVGNLIGLSDLHLQNNQIWGEIPGYIGNCKSLTYLDLSNNRLTGQIPPILGQLLSLSTLDLSVNKLNGEIPESLENLRLTSFNVSDNNLRGPVPYSMMINPVLSSSFQGNPSLCGEQLLGVNPCATSKNSKFLGGILVGVFGALVFLILLVGLLFSSRRNRSCAANVAYNYENHLRIWTTFQKLNFHEWEIVNAALRDDNLIGSGGFGKVYKTTLSNGYIVAVKQLHIDLHNDRPRNDSGFDAEVETLGSIRHKNIVKLLCCCCDNVDSKLLVYEYMENGSLKDALHGRKVSLLDQATRYRIALGSAQGLAYLHHDCKPPIVHRDVKSANILLDSTYEARVADFGLARILENFLVTDIMGTPGYIAPEHCNHVRRVTEKSDVYSFGIVLLELVTGKPALDPEVGDDATNILSWVGERMKYNVEFDEAFDQILDPSLSRYSSGLEQTKQLLRVALLCTKAVPHERPTMREVVNSLMEGHLCVDTQAPTKSDGAFSL